MNYQDRSMTPHEIDALWEDRQNWRYGMIYCCGNDPRVIVPKRPRWAGWTVNFAHPGKAAIVLLLLVGVLFAPAGAAIIMGAGTTAFFVLLAAGVCCMIALAAFMSNSSRASARS